MRLIVLKMEQVSVKNSSEGYTSETWRSMSESNGILPDSQHVVTQTRLQAVTAKVWCVSCCFFFTSDFTKGEFGRSKSLLEIFTSDK